MTTTEPQHKQHLTASSQPITVEVAVPLPIDGTFHYLVPQRLAEKMRPGIRILVPFARRKVTAYLLGFGAPPEGQRLREILDVLDDEPLWTEGELAFFRWVSDYYMHPLGEVLKTALPAGINRQSRKCGDDEVMTGGRNVRKERSYSSTGLTPLKPLRGRTAEMDRFLREAGPTMASELRSRFGECSANLRRLIAMELVSMTEKEIYRDPFAGISVRRDLPRQLTNDQQTALNEILGAVESAKFKPFLLHGVTGSGKTEIYLQAIQHCLGIGKSALVLVPEISLTPQLVQRFRSRFDKGIAVLHSALSEGERYDEWRRIRRGEANIVIGARSALFAPLERIGIIVVDEEHEASFKQSDGLRYNARDLALVRGQMENAAVILGSATPLVTTWQATMEGRLTLLRLPFRVADRPMPSTKTVTVRGASEPPISSDLIQALSENLERGEQSMLFLNRRGFAASVSCTACGENLSCPNCSVSLTYHRQRAVSLCHYCDYQVPAPGICPSCGETELKELGIGTERVEHEIRERFPNARVARMDSDTTSGKGGHARILDRVANGEIDILVGTQMIAKGHDFPGVTLVGVLQGEGSLYIPDFRSAERTFQVLSQVIGRAGRGDLTGKVILQSCNPEHYAIQHAVNHNFEAFCAEELSYREELGYPPFGFLAAILTSGTSASTTGDSAVQAARLLTSIKARLGLRVEILGPAEAPLYRLRGRFRLQILLKAKERSAIRRMLACYRRDRTLPSNIRESIDIDPVDLL